MYMQYDTGLMWFRRDLRVEDNAALHMALKVGGVEPDDEVLVSTLTFIASANAALKR